MDQDTHQTQPQTPPANDLPADYPFDPTSNVFSGVLSGSEALIYDYARTFRRDDLAFSDFEREPEYAEDELNYQLGELRQAVQQVADTLATEGPWQGIDPSEDVPAAVAVIKALMNNLLVPANSVEDAIVEARISGLERQRGTAKYQEGVRWRARVEFDNQVAEAVREGTGEHLPLDLRLAHLDRLIALAQLYRANVLRNHHHDAYLKRLR